MKSGGHSCWEKSKKAIFSQPGPPQSHGWNLVSVPSMVLVLQTSSSLRMLEGQDIFDVSGEVASK